VPVGIGHRSVEAQLLGATSKRPVCTDDLALPNRLHETPEEIDLRFDALDRLLDLLDGRGQGDGHDRELCGDRLLGRHGDRLQRAVGDDLAARPLPEQPVEPVAGGGQRSGLEQRLPGRIELEHLLARAADRADERGQGSECAQGRSG